MNADQVGGSAEFAAVLGAPGVVRRIGDQSGEEGIEALCARLRAVQTPRPPLGATSGR
ncbi:hypothetical protein [Streptomyces sp. NRRL B-11253]|uniref:hypothetical protein n=1 Tax=Streptomyces sp. NRRL B-11253 TaxID=1463826 RepID=UPI000AE458E8|nr:hypothetical protein [Streptomyces sp. NRRL B-11253]